MARAGHLRLWVVLALVVGFVVATWLGSRWWAPEATSIVASPWDRSAPGVWGADHVGRSVWARTLAGGFSIVGQSLLIGPAVTGLGLLVAVLVAGRQWAVWWATQLSTFMLAVPVMVIVVVFTAWTSAPTAVASVMLLAGVPFSVRVLLPECEGLLRAPFVEAGVTRGDRRFWVVARDVVPAMAASVLSDVVTRTVVTVHLLAAVHVLGRGPQAPQADWGVMIVSNLPGYALNPASVMAPAGGLVLWCVLLGVVANQVNAVFAVDRSVSGEPRRWLRRIQVGAGGVELHQVQLVQDHSVVLNVDRFTAHRGAVTAVVGATGSGKSTLVSVCAGLSRPGLQVLLADQGGRLVGVPKGRRRRRQVLGWVDQDPLRTFAPKATVVEVVRDGRRWLSDARCGEVLIQVGLPKKLWAQSALTLSGGQAVRVALARAMVGRPELLILDEPTAGLDQAAALVVAEVVEQASKFAAVIVVSHDVGFVAQVASTVVELRDRALIARPVRGGAAESSQVVQVGSERSGSASDSDPGDAAGHGAVGGGDVEGFVADQVQVGFGGTPVCFPVSVHASAGELVAVVGPSGCGKSTLLRAFAGLHSWTGSVFWQGERAPGGQGVLGSFWVPQDSARALPPMASLGTLAARYEPRGGAAGKSVASRMLGECGIDVETARRRPGEVSGGQRQRTAVVQALVSEADVLLLDEPTSALDERTASLVAEKLRQYADRGSLVVVATHDPIVIAQADQVVTLVPL